MRKFRRMSMEVKFLDTELVCFLSFHFPFSNVDSYL
jgi:hypothetical protein